MDLKGFSLFFHFIWRLLLNLRRQPRKLPETQLRLVFLLASTSDMRNKLPNEDKLTVTWKEKCIITIKAPSELLNLQSHWQHVGRKLNKMHPFKLCNKISVKSTNFKIFLIYGNVIIWHMLLSFISISALSTWNVISWVDIGVRHEERLRCGQSISQQEL